MASVLAIVPGGTPREPLDRLQRELSGHELTIVATSAEALASIDASHPDLVVFPIALASDERAPLVSKLRELSDDDDPQCRLFDALGSAEGMAADTRWFYWFRPPGPAAETNKEQPDPRADGVLERASRPLRGAQGVLFGAAARLRAAARSTARKAYATVRTNRTTAERAPGAPAQAGKGARAASRSGPSLAGRIGAARAPLRRWAPRVAIVAVLVGAGVTGRAYWISARPSLGGLTTFVSRPGESRRPAAGPGRGTAAAAANTGSLLITSDPVGAAVLLGGRERGVTPLTIDRLPAGTHAIVLASPAGRVRRSAVVKAGERATVHGAIYSGWLAVYSPIELQVSQGGRIVRLDEQSQAMLPPGPHELSFTNAALGYRETRTVEIMPGETSRVSIPAPRSTLTVTATTGAQVWVDGARIGDAPIVDMPIDVGIHEVVLRHTQHGERRITLTATMAPARVDVDLTSPQP